MSKKDEALKLALDELVYWRDKILRNEDDSVADEYDETLAAIREALAEQPAQHPDEFKCPLCYDDPANIKPAQQQEPVAKIIFGAKRGFADTPEWAYPTTQPAQQEPLTDEKIKNLFSHYGQYATGKDLALIRAIEAALKAKNT